MYLISCFSLAEFEVNFIFCKVVKRRRVEEPYEPTPFLQTFFTYLCYTILDLFGHLREFLRKYGFEKRQGAKDNNTDVNFYFFVLEKWRFFFEMKQHVAKNESSSFNLMILKKEGVVVFLAIIFHYGFWVFRGVLAQNKIIFSVNFRKKNFSNLKNVFRFFIKKKIIQKNRYFLAKNF